MKIRTLFNSLITLALLFASLTRAHHAVHGRYDYEARITLTGKIIRVDWVNPHVRILLEVTQQDGSIMTWDIASAPAQFMRRTGLSKSKLMNDGGEPVTVVGIRSRNPEINHIWGYRIIYADGHLYELSMRRPDT